MSKRALQNTTQDKFRDAHLSIKAMRQKIADSKVALDRWDSTKNDLALKAAENKWTNRTKGNIFRAWREAVVEIQNEREEHRLNPPIIEKVDNADENYKEYSSMIDLVHNMKSRCGEATHILEVDHELVNTLSRQKKNADNAEDRPSATRSRKHMIETTTLSPSSSQTSSPSDWKYKLDEAKHCDDAKELSPLSELSQRIYRETRQRDIGLRHSYHLPLQHFESPRVPHYSSGIQKTPASSYHTTKQHQTGRSSPSPYHIDHHFENSEHQYEQSLPYSPHQPSQYTSHYTRLGQQTPPINSMVSPPRQHYGLTPQPPLTTRQPTAMKRTASPLSRMTPISVKFYRPVSSPDRSIPTWLQYKHQEYY